MKPSVSIVICTRNRAEHLRQTLAALEMCAAPADMQAEIVVVDNGSSDNTNQVVESTPLAGLPIRYILENKPGQCRARNRGLKESAGSIILFTDDDVRPPKFWLTEMCEPIITGKADAVAGGIKLAPHLLARPWMTSFHRNSLAETGWIDPQHPQSMVGANMAFGRHVLEQVREFDVELGPGALGFHDDVLFSRQINAAGYKMVSALQTIVEHHPDESRLSHQSFVDTAVKYGRSMAYIAYHWEHEMFNHPRLRLWRRRMKLAKYELQNRHRRKIEGISQEHFNLIRDVSFMRQYLKEMKHPRNYEQHGLVRTSINQQPKHAPAATASTAR